MIIIVKLFLLLVLSTGFNFGLIKLLTEQRVFQPIYELGPDTHQDKSSVPSFGGIGILLSLFAGLSLFSIFDPRLIWVAVLMFVFGMIGFIDDYLSYKKGKNKGLSAKQKFWIQIGSAVVFLGVFQALFGGLTVLLFLFYGFLIIGSSNATNLTDGLDGLLGGLSLITLSGFWVYSRIIGWQPASHFCLVMMIGCVAFLIFNVRPARIFMGDTGSLALGAGFAGLAIVFNQPLMLIALGAVFIIETLSVILQVAYFKRTKRRIFLMSPLHHHFELLGLSEHHVVFLFWALGVIFLGVFLIGGV